MAATPDKHQPLDPEDELTKPEIRPALRAPASATLPPAAPPAAPSLDEDDEVTKVDPRRQHLVNPDALPADLPELE